MTRKKTANAETTRKETGCNISRFFFRRALRIGEEKKKKSIKDWNKMCVLLCAVGPGCSELKTFIPAVEWHGRVKGERLITCLGRSTVFPQTLQNASLQMDDLRGELLGRTTGRTKQRHSHCRRRCPSRCPTSPPELENRRGLRGEHA